jgi:hypothetical protein
MRHEARLTPRWAIQPEVIAKNRPAVTVTAKASY